MKTTQSPATSRRTVLRTAAWTVPAVAAVTATPAFAATGPVSCTVGVPVAYTNRAWSRPWTDANMHTYMRWNEMTPSGTRPLPPGITEGDLASYHNVFTGWLGTAPAGDSSPVVTAGDYGGGPVDRDGFASGADNGRTADTSFTVTYQFPVKGGATYTLEAPIWANAGYLVSQQMTATYAAPGVAGELARITSSASWNTPPAGYEQLAGATTKTATATPTDDGVLTVSYLFNLTGLPKPWPTPGYQQNGDISISAPTLTPTAGC